jgi:hypothetical protein
MVLGPVRPEVNDDCAGEGQQQFTPKLPMHV